MASARYFAPERGVAIEPWPVERGDALHSRATVRKEFRAERDAATSAGAAANPEENCHAG
jgi:hypothetical protein